MKRLIKLIKLIKLFWDVDGLYKAMMKRNGGVYNKQEGWRICDDTAAILFKLGCIEVQAVGDQRPTTEPCLVLSNHISTIDMPLIFSQMKVSFVSKKEVGDYPIFSSSIRITNSILIERGNKHSKDEVRAQLAHAILHEKKQVCLFPEATTSLNGTTWKRGSFALAKSHHILVQPVRLTYEPLYGCAFLDEEMLIPHLWRLLGQNKILAKIEFGKPLYVDDIDATADRLQKWSRDWSIQNA